MMNRIRPISISAVSVERRNRLGELIGDDAGHAVTGIQQGDATLNAVADDHGDGHGLTQRTPEAQDNRAQDAGLAVRDQHLPDGLPFGGTQRLGSFPL